MTGIVAHGIGQRDEIRDKNQKNNQSQEGSNARAALAATDCGNGEQTCEKQKDCNSKHQSKGPPSVSP